MTGILYNCLRIARSIMATGRRELKDKRQITPKERPTVTGQSRGEPQRDGCPSVMKDRRGWRPIVKEA